MNWASLLGVLLLFYGLATAPLSIVQIFFALQRRADLSPSVMVKTMLILIQGVGRLVMLPLCGALLFFQGWRLDPILQFAQFLLALGVVVESMPRIVSDYQEWRSRKGRASVPTPMSTDLNGPVG